MIAIIMLLGVGFFYGHYDQIGQLIQSADAATPVGGTCRLYVN